MPTRNTLTLALKGDVRASDFAVAADSLYHLVASLTNQYGRNQPIDWFIESLEKSSAIVTYRGICETADARFQIQDIVDAYEDVGQNLSKGASLDKYSHATRSHAERIVSVI